MDFTNAKLPPIYKRNGKDCYLDPIRKKLIPITPEETVRQKVISYLMDTLEVPEEMILVEEHLSHFGLKSRKRADIVILGKGKDVDFPLTIIECKAGDVPLDEKALDQAVGYSNDLFSDYVVLTNGNVTLCFKYEEIENKYLPIERLPKYEGMLTGECVPVEPFESRERVPYESLEDELLNGSTAYGIRSLYSISEGTSMELALPCFNLLEGLLDDSVKMPTGDYGLFELLEDYGVRTLVCGNASGGAKYHNHYRSFLIKADGNTEFYSLGFNTYRDYDEAKRSKNLTYTILCVAFDDDNKSHHCLQLSIDQSTVADGKTIKFFHNGKITVGNQGSCKTSELKELVEKRYPNIVMGDKFYLGSITADHLLRLNEPDVIDLVVNLISYSIVRNEYREIVNNRAQKTKRRK